jgi:Protein of unknown function (DUF3611)
MTRDTRLTQSLPPAIEKVSKNLQRWGFWSFWLQLILGVISTVILLFSTPALFETKNNAQGIQFGIFSAFISIFLLIASLVISFRYKKIGVKIENPDPALRPKKSETMKLIQMGLIFNLVGMLFAILGAEALVGLTLGKIINLPQQSVTADPSQFVNASDLLIIQANTNTIAAHFAGVVTHLILVNRISN